MTQAQAISIREARLARVRMIRKRVIMGALALFVATWLLITLMLISGHDPALAQQSSVGSAAVSSTPSTSSSTPSTSPSAPSTSSSSGAGGSSSGMSSVTSSQS